MQFAGVARGPHRRARAWIRQLTSYDNDILINAAADACPHAATCLQTLNGKAHDQRHAGYETIKLPSLVQVHGDVELHYPWPGPQQDPNVPLGGRAPIQLPSLASVDGALMLTGEGDPVSTDFELVLEALTSVSGNVSIDLHQAYGTGLSGLTALTSLSGDLSVVAGGGDLTLGGPFPLVAHARQRQRAPQPRGPHVLWRKFMPALTTVGGNLEHVSGSLDTLVLGNLETVGGAVLLQLTDVYAATGPPVTDDDYVLAKLSSVGGVFTLSDDHLTNTPKSNLRYGNAAGLLVGGLVVQNMNLTTMDAAHISVVPSGPISITNNPNLCLSEVADLKLAGLRLASHAHSRHHAWQQ